MIDAQEVKTQSPIEAIARELYGITFDAHGHGRCYFHQRHTHDDADPSLRLNRERQTIYCASQQCFGEKPQDVFGLVQTIDDVDFRTALEKLAHRAGLNGRPRVESPRPQIVAQYDYCDEQGAVLYQVVRQEPGPQGQRKTFKIRRPNGDGGWIWSADGVRLVPYHLDALSTSSSPVIIAEGEKCVDALRTLGFTATTNPYGAHKWRNEYSPYLKSREVILWPDNDPSGQSHVQQVAQSLVGLASSLRLVIPPGALPATGDVVDGIEQLGWDRAQVQAILDQAIPWEPSAPHPAARGEGKTSPTFTISDDGNADRLIAWHGQDLRYCPERGWMNWDGRRWSEDRTGEVRRRAVETAKRIGQEAAAEPDPERSSALYKHAGRCLSDSRLKAMIASAETKLPMPVLINAFDRDPLLLNVLNGTLDLRTGRLHDHRREDLLTKLALVEYDAEALCPRWEAFLHQVMDGRMGLVGYLQRIFGYTLTASLQEQVYFLLYGTGANGKTVLLTLLRALLGDYAQQADFGTFLLQRNDGPRNDLARLAGARAVVAAEADSGRRLSEAVIKQLTGGDVVTARFLHQEYFEFIPQFKLFLAANHKPVIRGTDYAIWRRTKLIPFIVTIPETARDPDLSAKLKDELPGILAWAVRGFQDWHEHGLREAEEVTVSTAEYRQDMDLLGDFLAERCVVLPHIQATAKDLYSAYTGWCKDNGEDPTTQHIFGRLLTDRGFRRDRGKGGRTIYIGVSPGGADGGMDKEPINSQSNGINSGSEIPQERWTF